MQLRVLSLLYDYLWVSLYLEYCVNAERKLAVHFFFFKQKKMRNAGTAAFSVSLGAFRQIDILIVQHSGRFAVRMAGVRHRD